MARTVGQERKSRAQSAENWQRYQAALNRNRGPQQSISEMKQEPEYHASGECERRGCHKPVYKSIYALGYLAGMCREHYEQASEKDKRDAVRFQYAER